MQLSFAYLMKLRQRVCIIKLTELIVFYSAWITIKQNNDRMTITYD